VSTYIACGTRVTNKLVESKYHSRTWIRTM